MKKVVSTQMSTDSVTVTVRFLDGTFSECPVSTYEFPSSLVNPRIALQIATLLVSDPTIPEPNVKEAKEN